MINIGGRHCCKVGTLLTMLALIVQHSVGDFVRTLNVATMNPKPPGTKQERSGTPYPTHGMIQATSGG
jgi:hypothetical protein